LSAICGIYHLDGKPIAPEVLEGMMATVSVLSGCEDEKREVKNGRGQYTEDAGHLLDQNRIEFPPTD